MKKIITATLLFHWLTTVTAQQQYSQTVKDQILRVENSLSGRMIIDGKLYTLSERMKHYNVAGVSVAVIDSHKIVWAKGYGYADKKEERKVNTGTMFEPGSISKSLHAVGILRLAQEGKIDLNQDINRYLANWKFPYDTVSHGKIITAAQLLTHTAGLGVHGFPGYHRDSAIASVTDILDGRAPSNTEAVRSLAEPGKETRYSGGGILISQQMVTDLTKQLYEQYMQERVLGPLGMTNSSFNQPPSIAQSKNLATGYKSNGVEVPGKYFVYPEKAAAGLWTTPTDICKYIIEIQLAYQGKSAKVLNQEMVKLHVMPYIDDVALGTYIQNRNGEKYFVHSASNEGFTGYFLGGLTNGKGVALFVNSEDGTVLLELLNSIAREYKWAGFGQAEQLTTVAIPDTLISKYTGEYILDGYLSEIKKERDGLYLWTDGIHSKMHFTSATSFRNIELGGTKNFIIDNAGTVTGYSNTINGRLRASGQKIATFDTLKPRPGQSGVMGRHLLETKNYEKAIALLTRGAAIEPSDSLLVKNLAHSYLFKGDFTKALELYQKYIKSGLNENELRKTLINDLEYFRNAGFDPEAIKKARETLSI